MPDELDKLHPGIVDQVTFAAATTLTSLAKKSQERSIDKIHGRFTVRSNWTQPSNKYGVRIKPATKSKLESSVRTAADWLAVHESGGNKSVDGNIAIPTEETRPKVSDIIPASKRPRRLSKAFAMTFKSGTMALVERVSSARYPLRILYNLVSSARIKKTSTVVEPTVDTVRRDLGKTFSDALKKAFATRRQ